jgi:phosphate transport system substrate-binding protein
MSPMRRWVGLLLAAVSVLLAGCAEAVVSTPRPVLITISGATAMHPVLQELTAAFGATHPNVAFTLRGGGSTLGEEQALAGRVNLGASTLFPPEQEVPRPVRLVRVPIGVDGLAVVVHPANATPGLSVEQLRRVFSGEILDWAEVGGAPGEIELVSREDGSGSRRLFEDRVMGDEPVSLTAVVMPTSWDVVDYVSRHPQTIAYVSRGLAMVAPRGAPPAAVGATPPAPAVRVLPIADTTPTLDAIRSQSYPLVQPLYLVSRGETRGVVRQFVDFVLSPAGQAIVARYHVPVR